MNTLKPGDAEELRQRIGTLVEAMDCDLFVAANQFFAWLNGLIACYRNVASETRESPPYYKPYSEYGCQFLINIKWCPYYREPPAVGEECVFDARGNCINLDAHRCAERA